MQLYMQKSAKRHESYNSAPLDPLHYFSDSGRSVLSTYMYFKPS